jgi:hypothetical protein
MNKNWVERAKELIIEYRPGSPWYQRGMEILREGRP